MSVEDLKRAVTALSPAEQTELTAFLFHLRHRGSTSGYAETVEGRLRDRAPARWLTPEEFEKRLEEK